MKKFPTQKLSVVLGALPLALGCAHRTPGGPPGSVAAGTGSAADVRIDAPREQTADQQVKHVLNRLAFGPRPGDYERVRAMGVDRWIAEQLNPKRINDRETDSWLAQFPTL